jgi:hypothetical protein
MTLLNGEPAQRRDADHSSDLLAARNVGQEMIGGMGANAGESRRRLAPAAKRESPNHAGAH